MKFSGEYRVNANDMDVNSIVSASGVMRFMQDAAFSQMEDAGMSYGRLVSEYGAAFILSTLRLRLYAPLYSHDRIIGESWACPSRGETFVRSHRILRGGAVMAEAVTAWALVGVTDKRLHRVGELALPYGEEETIPIDTPTRLKIPAELAMPQVGTHTVTYTDIDSNGHMNNTKYPDLLCGYIGDMRGRRVTSLLMHFQHEAPLGETIRICCGSETDNAYYLRTLRADGTTNVEAQVTLAPME